MSELFNYRVGAVSWEQSSTTLLTHTKEFTDTEFQDMCVECYADILVDKIVKYVKDGTNDVAALLCKKYGFKKLEMKTFTVFDEFDSFDDMLSDNYFTEDDELNLIITKCKEKIKNGK